MPCARLAYLIATTRRETLTDTTCPVLYGGLPDIQMLACTPDPDALCMRAGQVCYDSVGKSNKTTMQYMWNILDKGHGSIMEHASITFLIRGVSRNLTHELIRHRHLSFSERSQRYCKEAMGVVVPPAMATGDVSLSRARIAFENCSEDSIRAYDYLVSQLPDKKAGREAARAILPGGTATEIVVTGNARAWRHFLHLRGSAGADAEIRRLAVCLAPFLQEWAPAMFQDVVVFASHPNGVQLHFGSI